MQKNHWTGASALLLADSFTAVAQQPKKSLG